MLSLPYSYLLQSFIVGILIAAPVGPIGLLCIRKTLQFGFRATIIIGFAAALADSLYGFLASVGVNSVSGFIQKENIALRIFGGLFLLLLGIKEIRTNTKNIKDISEIAVPNSSYVKLFIKTFILTITNPLTLFSFAAIFASINMAKLTLENSFIIALAIFSGSITWWVLLGRITLTTKKFLAESLSHRIYVATGIMLICFALWSWISLLFV